MARTSCNTTAFQRPYDDVVRRASEVLGGSVGEQLRSQGRAIERQVGGRLDCLMAAVDYCEETGFRPQSPIGFLTWMAQKYSTTGISEQFQQRPASSPGLLSRRATSPGTRAIQSTVATRDSRDIRREGAMSCSPRPEARVQAIGSAWGKAALTPKPAFVRPATPGKAVPRRGVVQMPDVDASGDQRQSYHVPPNTRETLSRSMAMA